MAWPELPDRADTLSRIGGVQKPRLGSEEAQ